MKNQFKYNTVLADALSDQVTTPTKEGVSTVLEQYFDDVMTMAQGAGKSSSVEAAFKKVVGNINAEAAPVSWLKRNEILQHDKVHLAEHHIYGSSRLGMQKYLPDELMFEDTVNASPYTYQSLTKLKPWYSMYGNDLFDTSLHRDSLVKGTISTRGMGVNTHILGNRHYELTNHLGNVQATVLDRTTPIIDDPVLIGYNADISTAQDYYPFGMYMPGRYISDTARHCITTNTTVMVARPVRVMTAVGKLPAQSMQFGGDPEPPAIGSLPKASAFEDEAPFVFHYNPAETHPDTWVVNTIPDDETIQYVFDFSDEPSGIGSFLQIHADTNQEVQPVNFGLELLDESMQAKARIRQYFEPDGEDYDATTWEDLTIGDQQLVFEVDKASVAAGGLTLLEIVFTSNEPYFAMNSKAIMHTPYTLKTSIVPTNVVTTICDDDDDYRFGFNGMEKDNEAKGLGNSMDFGARIYDSRLGRFLSLDPMTSKFPGQSPYIYAGNSPILFVDKKGEYKYPEALREKYAQRFPMITAYLSTQIEKDISNSSTIIAAYQKVNSNISEQTIKGLSKWGSGYDVVFVDAPGEGEFGDLDAAGYTEKGRGQPIEMNARYADFVEEALKSKDYSIKQKQVIFTRFYMTLLHETAHKNNELIKNVGPGEDGNDRYITNTNGVSTEEVGEVFEEEVWGTDEYRPTNKDPQAATKPGGVKGIRSEKYSKGVTEDIIENAEKSDEGRKTLPTIPSK